MGYGPLNMNVIKMTQISNAKVRVDSVQMDFGQVRIDVILEDIPVDLFGVSFHFVMDGVDVTLENYVLGEVFGGEDPIVLVKEKNEDENKIIFGVSLKRDENISAQSGKLVSFYIQPKRNGGLRVNFENEVMSIIDNGRVDLEGVEWNGSSIMIEGVENAVGEGEVVEKIILEEAAWDEFEELASESELSVSVLTRNEEAPLLDLYGFLFITLFVFVFGYLVFLWINRKKA